MPRPDEPLGVMFLMDEFPTLGNMEQFKNGIAYFRGYKVRLMLIIQDTEQLKDHYEEAGMSAVTLMRVLKMSGIASTASRITTPSMGTPAAR